MATATAATPSGEPPLSQMQRVINVFVAPSKTFNDIRRNSSWFVPWLLMAVMSYAFVGVVATRVGWETVNENQLKMQPKRAEQMEKLKEQQPQQYERQHNIGILVTKVISFVFPLVILLNSVIIAAIMMATMNFGASAKTGFGACLAVVIYASLPGLVKSALAILFLFLGVGVDSFTFQNPIASNPGVFATVGTPLYSLLSALDIFTIWILVLASIGFSCISGLKRSTTMSFVFGWYALVTMIGVGFTALFA